MKKMLKSVKSMIFLNIKFQNEFAWEIIVDDFIIIEEDVKNE